LPFLAEEGFFCPRRKAVTVREEKKVELSRVRRRGVPGKSEEGQKIGKRGGREK